MKLTFSGLLPVKTRSKKPVFLNNNRGSVFQLTRHKRSKPPKMENGRILQIFRDGKRTVATQRLQLPPGAQGNLITLREMAKIVREDSKLSDLKNFAFREVIGLDKRTLTEQINAAYEFCRDRIIYDQEKSGYETIADLWSCFYSLNPLYPIGDCAIKSVALATCLSYLNLKPYFVAVRQVKNVDYFNHVFVGIDEGGKHIGLDPTPNEFFLGQEVNSYQRLNYRIFE